MGEHGTHRSEGLLARRCWVVAGLVLVAVVLLVLLAVALLGGDDHSGEFKPIDEYRVHTSVSIAMLEIGFLVVPVGLVWVIGAIAVAREAYGKGHSFWRTLGLGLVLSPVITARRLRRDGSRTDADPRDTSQDRR